MQRPFASVVVVASVAAFVASCSGADFEVAGPPADDSALDSSSDAIESGSDTSVDSGVDTTVDDATDTSIGETGPGDTGPGDADSADVKDSAEVGDSIVTIDGVPSDAILDGGCLGLTSDATDVYVDAKVKPGGTGTLGCPFNTILQASALTYTGSGVRTIHVAGGGVVDGGTTLVTYAETAPIIVGNKIILVAEPTGLALVKCNTSACVGSSPARGSIEVGYGGKVDGFAVEAGMATYPVVTLTSSTVSAVPVLVNLLAQNGTTHGIAVNGSADLGPNVRAYTNGGAGLALLGAGTGRVLGTGDIFDFNSGAGVLVAGSSVLDFQGGEASLNTGNGINVGSTSTATQSIANLKAKSNNANGISTGDTFKGTLKIRGSYLANNLGFGLRFIFQYDPSTGAAANFLDIGASGSDPGNVVFNELTVKNTKGGMCLGQTNGPDSQPAHTDKFSFCDPVQVNRDCTLGALTVYADIWYLPRTGSTAGNPVKISSCGVGP